MSTPIEGRYERQSDILPAERLAEVKAAVVGVGAIGRQVALQLAAIGLKNLTLIDFDTVDPENLCCQGYLESDLGSLKTEATKALIEQINSDVDVTIQSRRWRRGDISDVTFCCVDSIQIRSHMWDKISMGNSALIDTRMSASVARVLAVTNVAGRRHYPTTLFAAEEAYAGSCTSKSTIYTANICAGMAVAQFAKWLREMPTDPDISFNILTSEMMYGDDPVKKAVEDVEG